MLEFVAAYSVEEILIFIIMLAAAVKGVISFLDWSNKRLKEHFDKGYSAETKQTQVDDRLERGNKRFDEISARQDEVDKRLDKISQQLDLLLASDRDDIKSFITREHHFFCYQKGWIDDYSLDCLEKRYSHYIEEHGNSFIGELMDEIRALPKEESGTGACQRQDAEKK